MACFWIKNVSIAGCLAYVSINKETHKSIVVDWLKKSHNCFDAKVLIKIIQYALSVLKFGMISPICMAVGQSSTAMYCWYRISQEICTHCFVVFCFVVVMQSFIMNSHEVFIHIHQGCFAGTGAIVRLPQCQWSKPDGYGTISQCITTTKHSKAKTVCIFLGIYCMCAKWRVLAHLWSKSKFRLNNTVREMIINLLTIYALEYSWGMLQYEWFLWNASNMQPIICQWEQNSFCGSNALYISYFTIMWYAVPCHT